jgi:hypothetical protein
MSILTGLFLPNTDTPRLCPRPPPPDMTSGGEEPRRPKEEETGLGQQNTDGDPVPLQPPPR